MFARQYTEQLLEMIDDGIVDKDYAIQCMTSYMSEDDVKDMMFHNEILPIEYDVDDDVDDDEDDDRPSTFWNSQEYKDWAERNGY